VHYSGVLILASPGQLGECVRELDALPGVEVRFRYPESGRIIAVQESETIDSQEDGLRRIRALPQVMSAGLVYHHVNDAPAISEPGS
jgi:nitrate reductase NapD